MNEVFNSQSTIPLKKEDKTELALRSIAQNVIAVVFGLLPLFFVPIKAAPFDYSKTFIVIIAVLLATIFYSLSVLRSGTVKFALPLPMLALWGVSLSAVISALISGDMSDSFIGNSFGVHTALFLVLLALVATITMAVGQSKASVMRLYMLLTFSAGVLTVYHVSRLLLGANFLSFGQFNSLISSPIGNWNDLGLLFGLIILLSLVALEQLPLTKWGKVMFSCAVALSLLMLAVVNFVAIWAVLLLVSLIVMMYSLTKDRFGKQSITKEAESSISIHSVVLSVSVFVVSLLFIIGGASIGQRINQVTGINYIEVRPSFSATVEIAKSVYQENAFVGIGPNRFSDAWRLYKDRSINETVFWNTNFAAGNGYVTTFFVTTGILGIAVWLLFVFTLLYAGYRMLFLSETGDKFWYFIGSSSFVAAAYLWCMSFIYVPGPTTILLAGIFTSVVFVSYSAIVPTKGVNLSVATNRRSAIVLVGLVMVVIVASASSLYFVSRHYTSVLAFREAVNSVSPGVNVEATEQKIASAYANNKNDVYAREIAQYQIAKMNALLSVSNPTPEQQRQFQEAATNGINAATLSIERDPTEPLNHATLATIYGILAAAGVEGSVERSLQSFATAREYDPNNPLYVLLEAQVESRTGDLETARNSALEAIQLKNNYTEALYFLTQLDIANGNVDEAIEATIAMVALEPQNAARSYQLGVLYSSQAKLEEAITSFRRAVSIDPSYANARYFLGLAYVESGDLEAGIAELEIVRDLNPDNVSVQQTIDQLRSGELTVTPADFVNAVSEPEGVVEDNNAVIGSEDLESPLITTVNAVPEDSAESATEVEETSN